MSIGKLLFCSYSCELRCSSEFSSVLGPHCFSMYIKPSSTIVYLHSITHHSFDYKTDLMIVTSKRTKSLHHLLASITVGNDQIPFKQSVKNFGFTLHCHLTMNGHISTIARTCHFELHRLSSTHKFPVITATATYLLLFCQ